MMLDCIDYNKTFLSNPILKGMIIIIIICDKIVEYYESFLSTIGLQHSVSILKENLLIYFQFLFCVEVSFLYNLRMEIRQSC